MISLPNLDHLTPEQLSSLAAQLIYGVTFFAWGMSRAERVSTPEQSPEETIWLKRSCAYFRSRSLATEPPCTT